MTLDLLSLWGQVQSVWDRLPPRLRSRKFWMAVLGVALNFRNPAAILRVILTYLGVQGAVDAAEKLRLPNLAAPTPTNQPSLTDALKAQGLGDDDILEILEQVRKTRDMD